TRDLPSFPTRRSSDLRTELARIDELVDFLESSCEVRGCQELASLDPERRENLVKWFGQHGAESILLAFRPGHVLWTDDLILAGRSEEHTSELQSRSDL